MFLKMGKDSNYNHCFLCVVTQIADSLIVSSAMTLWETSRAWLQLFQLNINEMTVAVIPFSSIATAHKKRTECLHEK